MVHDLQIRAPYLKREEGAVAKKCSKGPFIYYVITFLGFFDPPPPLCNHVFSTENNQKLAFSDPPLPPTSDYVIYECSLKKTLFSW